MVALKALENVRGRMIEASAKLGAENVPNLSIPQICAVGDQSAGKSALMQAISDIPFPQSTGTCTKCPIVVDMQPLEENGAKPLFTIDGSVATSDADEFCDEIKRKQAELLKSSGTAFSSVPMKIKAVTSHKHRLVCVDLPGIIHVTEDAIQVNEDLYDIVKDDSGTADIIQNVDEARLEYYVDNKVNSVEMIKGLIRQYVAPNETLIVVVMPAAQDEELASALKFAREADQGKARTLS